MKKQIIRKAKYVLNRLAAVMNPVEKKITFESYDGRQYSDNPRFISEKMHELYPDYKLVWGIQNGQKTDGMYIPDYVEVVPVKSWKYLRERASSVAFINNETMTEELYKRRGQFFIQTWHGDRGIKKILFDSLKARGISAKDYGFADHKLTDMFVVGSDYAKNRIRTAFQYNGQVLLSGCPRNDCLVNPGDCETIKRRLGISPDQKVLLYAPTLRRNSSVVQATVDLGETLDHLKARDGSDWLCLVRAHPKSLGIRADKGSGIIDVSKYPDMADLLMIADCLITDYSSCAGDFILTGRPMMLAQFDLEQYMEEDRTFHVDIADTGFLIARNQGELNNLIDTMSDEDFAENCRKIMNFFGTHETGHSAEDVCRWINEKYKLISK